MAYAFLFINSESVNGEMPKYNDKFRVAVNTTRIFTDLIGNRPYLSQNWGTNEKHSYK
jgi:hypothetical protein